MKSYVKRKSNAKRPQCMQNTETGMWKMGNTKQQ